MIYPLILSSGETETTFLQSFCSANNLKTILVAKRVPEVLQEFVDLIDCAFVGETTDEDPPTAHVTPYDVNSEPVAMFEEKKATQLPVDIYQNLLERIISDPTLSQGYRYRSVHAPTDRNVVLSPMAQVLRSVKHRGTRYTGFSFCRGDSHVLFRSTPPDETIEEPRFAIGQIQSIFLHKRLLPDGQYRSQVFVILRRFAPLSQDDAHLDPYQRHRAMRVSLVYAIPLHENLVKPIRDIVSHVATCPYRDDRQQLREKCIVAVPLDEVRPRPE